MIVCAEQVRAEEATLDASVPEANLTFQHLSRASQLPFKDKVDWFNKQCDLLRVPWDVEHQHLKVCFVKNKKRYLEGEDVAHTRRGAAPVLLVCFGFGPRSLGLREAERAAAPLCGLGLAATPTSTGCTTAQSKCFLVANQQTAENYIRTHVWQAY